MFYASCPFIQKSPEGSLRQFPSSQREKGIFGGWQNTFRFSFISSGAKYKLDKAIRISGMVRTEVRFLLDLAGTGSNRGRRR